MTPVTTVLCQANIVLNDATNGAGFIVVNNIPLSQSGNGITTIIEASLDASDTGTYNVQVIYSYNNGQPNSSQVIQLTSTNTQINVPYNVLTVEAIFLGLVPDSGTASNLTFAIESTSEE